MEAAKTWVLEPTREEAMYDVLRRWHEVEQPDDIKSNEADEKSSTESLVAKISSKMATIVTTRRFHLMTPSMEDVVKQLGERSRELDPEKEGVNFVRQDQICYPVVPVA